MNTKKNLSRFGAGALATATVVAGLSFGPAAANAAPTDSSASGRTSTQAVATSADTKAALPAVELVSGSGSWYTDAAGNKGTPGATSRYTTPGFAWNTGPVFDAKGEATIANSSAGGASGIQVGQTLTGQPASANTLISIDSFKNQLPAVEYVSGSYYTNASGKKIYTFELTGTPGATVRWAPPGMAWSSDASSPKFDAKGNVTIAGTGYVGPDSVNFNQILDGQTGTTITVPLSGMSDTSPAYKAVTLTSPTSGSTYDANSSVTFTGTGTPGGRITVTPGQGIAPVTTTVGDDGKWSVAVTLGTANYSVTVAQRAQGQSSTVDNITLTPASLEVDLPWTVTAPTSGSTANGPITFTGTGNAGETVTIHNTTFDSADVTTTVGKDGHWSVSRWVGTGYYSFDVTQTNAADTVTGSTTGIEINKVAAPINKPFAVTTAPSGDVPTAGYSFEGTGKAGATVTLTPITGQAPVSTIVDDEGNWKVIKFIGTSRYEFTVKMTKDGVTESLANIVVTGK